MTRRPKTPVAGLGQSSLQFVVIACSILAIGCSQEGQDLNSELDSTGGSERSRSTSQTLVVSDSLVVVFVTKNGLRETGASQAGLVVPYVLQEGEPLDVDRILSTGVFFSDVVESACGQIQPQAAGENVQLTIQAQSHFRIVGRIRAKTLMSPPSPVLESRIGDGKGSSWFILRFGFQREQGHIGIASPLVNWSDAEFDWLASGVLVPDTRRLDEIVSSLGLPKGYKVHEVFASGDTDSLFNAAWQIWYE